MRANDGAPVALHAVCRIPVRKICCDAALFECCCAVRHHAVCGGYELGNRYVVCSEISGRNEDVVQEVCVYLIASYELLRFRIIRKILPCFGYFNLMDVVEAGINCLAVHVNDVLTLLAVGLLDSVLHVFFSLVDRNDISQLEECSLEDGVGTSCTETDLLGQCYSIAGVELNVVLSDVSLYSVGKVVLEFFI